MIGVSIFIFIGLGICGKWSSAQILNNRPFPTYSLEDMPDTDFSCRDKILGGYYADPQTQCQMFHVCVKISGVGVQDFRFLCPNSTAFDQEHQICANWEDVDCDVATLYYSSDNFDLYRIGSGFESKAVKYGEEEEPFALQRAETGDIRLNREHQTESINQQKENKNRHRINNPQTHQHTNQRNNNNYNHNDNEKDIFKVSSSSNFFNNRNSGKDSDDYDYDNANVNANQNDDRSQKRKVSHRSRNKPQYEESHTQKPNRPTGFINNFAGSSYTTTSRPEETTLRNEQRTRSRGRQRQRGNHHYNANRFQQSTAGYREDDGQYHEKNSDQYNQKDQEPRYTVSTPAPFRRFQQQEKINQFNYDQYSTTSVSKISVSSTERVPSFTELQKTAYSNNNQFDSSQYGEAQNYPTRLENTQVTGKQTQSYSPVPFEKHTQVTDKYSLSSFKQDKSYSSTPFIHQTQETQNSSPSPFKQGYSYTPTPFQKQSESDTSSTTFRNTQQYTIAPFYKESRVTDGSFSTSFNQSPSSPNQFKQQPDNAVSQPLPSFSQDQTYQNQPNTFEKHSTQFPSDSNTRQDVSNYEITKNKQASEYSSSQNFKKPTTFAKTGEVSPTTFSPKTSPVKSPESYLSTTGNKALTNPQVNQQTNINNKQTNYNQDGTYNQQTSASRSSNTPYNPYFSQPFQPNTQTTRNFEFKRTTQHTHYTPTVPRVTTPYYSSTTRAPNSKRSNRFDETQYDDGSYNPKYDNEEGDKNNDELLKTAHSSNFASSKNEYSQNTKNLQVSQTQKPRPFSVTPNPPKQFTYTQSSISGTNNTQNLSNASSNQPSNSRKSKDSTYDYAYYDSNAGNDHEYDIGIDIEKSGSAKNKQSS